MASIDEAKEIIKSTPISSILTFYISLNKKGANYMALCPFHSDSNPSMSVNDDKGIYKCFVCGAAGDSIKFVQDRLNLSFVESIKDISSQLGINIEEKQSKNKDPKYDIAERVIQSAHKLYRKVASEQKPKNFIEFSQKRNLTVDTRESFQIGYAPSNNALSNYLSSLPDEHKKMALSVAEQIGIIRPQKYGEGFYDFFRDRIVFPIWDHGGKVKGFSSRAVLPDQKPKYLNSKESFIFDKGNILFAFNFAKKSIREKDSVLIVEGHMDAIMMHQYGFTNTVATQGVALSQSSIRVLTNMTKNIFLAMDSDPAGLTAMGRINKEILETGVIPKMIDFSPAKDPDEFLNEFGRLKLVEKMEEAPSFIDFSIGKLIPGEIPPKTDQKLAILEQIFAVVSPLKTNLLATEKVIQSAKTLGLKSSDDDVVQEYKSFLQSNKPKFSKPMPTPQNHPTENQIDTPINEEISPAIETIEIPKVEKLLLETLLTHPECTNKEQMSEILDKIQHFEVKRIVQWAKDIYVEIDETDYPLFLKEKNQEALPESVKTVIASALYNFKPTKLEDKVATKMMKDLILGLEINQLKVQKSKLIKNQKDASTDEDGLAVLAQIQEVEKKLNALKK